MKKLNFLVVDDSPTMRKIIANSLKRLGHKGVKTAANGAEAIKELDLDKDINFIITDWNMPYMDGISLVKQLKSDNKYNDIKILMITTRGQKSEIIKAINAGVDNYIVKPFTQKVLKEKLDIMLNKTD